MSHMQEDFVGVLQQMAEMSGMDRALAEIFALVYMEPEEISLEELARLSGYSPSSVSTKVNLLEKMGLVTKKRKPHTNRIFAYTEKEFVKLITSHVLEAQKKKFAFAKEKLPALITKYKAKKLSENETKKLAIIEEYYKSVMRFEKMYEGIAQMMKKEAQ